MRLCTFTYYGVQNWELKQIIYRSVKHRPSHPTRTLAHIPHVFVQQVLFYVFLRGPLRGPLNIKLLIACFIPVRSSLVTLVLPCLMRCTSLSSLTLRTVARYAARFTPSEFCRAVCMYPGTGLLWIPAKSQCTVLVWTVDTGWELGYETAIWDLK